MTFSLRHITGFVVLLWVVALFYDALTVPPPLYDLFGLLVEAERSRTLLVFVGVAIAAGAALIIVKRFSYIAIIVAGTPPNLLLFVLALNLIMLGILQGNPSGVAYSILLGLTLILTMYVNRCLSEDFYLAVSVLLVCSLLAFILYHGLPNNRWIGGIHPNHTGAFALSSVYFAAKSRHRNRWLLYVIATSVAVLVSSRYAIVAILIIGGFDYLTRIKLSPSRLFFTTLAAFLGFIIIVAASDYILNDVLRLHDTERGLESGLAGRVDMWGNFWEQFVRHPFIGYGFRSRDDYVPTHNGFLNFTLENGVFIACLLVAVVFSSIHLFILSYRLSGDPRQLMGIGFWLAWLVAGFLQPQIINFGDAFALMTFFLLTDNQRHA